MTDSHTTQGQAERAKRLRQQIENLKTGGQKPAGSEHQKSLREQVEERAKEVSDQEQKQQ